jgi:hypothetical protein
MKTRIQILNEELSLVFRYGVLDKPCKCSGFSLGNILKACVSTCRSDRAGGNHKPRKSRLATRNDDEGVYISTTQLSLSVLYKQPYLDVTAE